MGFLTLCVISRVIIVNFVRHCHVPPVHVQLIHLPHANHMYFVNVPPEVILDLFLCLILTLTQCDV